MCYITISILSASGTDYSLEKLLFAKKVPLEAVSAVKCLLCSTSTSLLQLVESSWIIILMIEDVECILDKARMVLWGCLEVMKQCRKSYPELLTQARIRASTIFGETTDIIGNISSVV